MPIALIAAVVIPLIANAIGSAIAKGDVDKAKALREQALAQFKEINPAELDNAVEKAKLGDTSFSKIQEDPEVRGAMMNALNKYADVTSNNGMDAQARAKQEEAIQSANMRARAQREGAMGRLANTGNLSGGARVGAELQAASDSANEGYRGSLDASAEAEKRVLEALAQTGQLGSRIREQDYQKSSDLANARDRFAMHNSNLMYQGAKDKFGGELSKAKGMAGAYNDEAEMYDSNDPNKNTYAQRTRKYAGDVGSAGSSLASSYKGA